MLGQAIVRTAWVIHYQWNKAVYLKYCENKDRPKLHCDGKCYLKKKVAAAETPSDQGAPVLPKGFCNGKDLQVFWETPFQLLLEPAEMSETSGSHLYAALASHPHLYGVFRPPAV